MPRTLPNGDARQIDFLCLPSFSFEQIERYQKVSQSAQLSSSPWREINLSGRAFPKPFCQLDALHWRQPRTGAASLICRLVHADVPCLRITNAKDRRLPERSWPRLRSKRTPAYAGSKLGLLAPKARASTDSHAEPLDGDSVCGFPSTRGGATSTMPIRLQGRRLCQCVGFTVALAGSPPSLAHGLG